MAASLKLLRLHTMHLNAPFLETRISCVRYSWINAAKPCNSVLVTKRRSKSTKVPEDKILPPIKVKRFFYIKVVNFLTTSVDNLEKRMPKTFQVYRTFRTGVSMFIADTKQYYGITSRLWNGESLSRFTRRELELYRQFSSDLPVMGMVLILAFAPGGVLIFPLAYTFPRFLLSPHFWTRQQTEDFRRKEMTKRLKHYPTVLDNMFHDGKGLNNKYQLNKALSKLDLSVNLSQKDIVSLKPLFEDKPFGLDCVSLRYRWHLCRSLGMSVRRKKLVKDALLIRFIDVALRREGIHNLTEEDLDRACACRGLNPEGVVRNAKLSYLKNWTEITTDVHEQSISLLLHLPILMAYCQPSNRKLMGSRHTSFRP